MVENKACAGPNLGVFAPGDGIERKQCCDWKAKALVHSRFYILYTAVNMVYMRPDLSHPLLLRLNV